MTMQDIIYIHAIRVRTVIGILPHERAAKQTLIISCELGTDTRAAGEADDIKQALDYAAICANTASSKPSPSTLPRTCSLPTHLPPTSASISRNPAHLKPRGKSVCESTVSETEAL